MAVGQNVSGEVTSPAQIRHGGTLHHGVSSLHREPASTSAVSSTQTIHSLTYFDRHRNDLASLSVSNHNEALLLQRNLITDLTQSIVWDHWDSLKLQTENAPAFENILVGSAGVTAGLFSVGYVMFALRGGYSLHQPTHLFLHGEC